ncbi:MAG: type VII toxin-antitoxin system MntA family adenylyltransferase antitoxin [Vicinamibacteria bacterium]
MKLAKSDLSAPEAESRVRRFFEGDPHGVIAVYLFGSFARGNEGPESDVDVAVLYSDAPARTFDALPLSLEEGLERRLGREVQAVVLNHAPADLIHRVLRDGKLLLDLAPTSRIRFEVQARNEYFDLQPILRGYRKTKI